MSNNLITIPKFTQFFGQKLFYQDKNGNFAMQNHCQTSRKIKINPTYFHPSFCGTNEISKLSKFLDEVIANPHNAELIKQSQIFNFEQILVPCINIKNRLGRGTNASVYRLDDEYAFKYHYRKDPNFKHFEASDNMFKKLKTWYGAELVKIGNISILKNADPTGTAIPVGVPFEINESEKIEKIYNKYLEECLKIPQKAFDDIAVDFKVLNSIVRDGDIKKGYSFDFDNPNNFVLENNIIKIVDDLNDHAYRNQNNVNQMLRMLIGEYNIYSPTVFENKLAPTRKEILKKCLLASEKAELPIPTEYTMPRFFELAGLANKWILFADKTVGLRNKIPNNHEERAYLLGKYLDTV